MTDVKALRDAADDAARDIAKELGELTGRSFDDAIVRCIASEITKAIRPLVVELEAEVARLGGLILDYAPAMDELAAKLQASEAEVARVTKERDEMEAVAIRMPAAKIRIAHLEGSIDTLDQQAKGLVEALTPSGGTKAAYIGEFKFSFPACGPDGREVTLTPTVPWTTVKEIMAAIKARADAVMKDSANG